MNMWRAGFCDKLFNRKASCPSTKFWDNVQYLKGYLYCKEINKCIM